MKCKPILQTHKHSCFSGFRFRIKTAGKSLIAIARAHVIQVEVSWKDVKTVWIGIQGGSESIGSAKNFWGAELHNTTLHPNYCFKISDFKPNSTEKWV